MILTIIRHGETEGNRDKVIQGQLGGELTRRGILQAQALARRLSRDTFDAIYSSDLKRAVDTTNIITRLVGNPIICLVPELREKSYGIFQGRSLEEFERWRSSRENTQERWGVREQDGESLLELEIRLRSFLALIARSHHLDSILISAHGWVNQILLKVLLDLSWPGSLQLRQDNCCVNLLDWKGMGTAELLVLNSTSHLKGERVGTSHIYS